MRSTKMLPVRDSVREFQELDSSPQDLQSQPRPRQVFSRCSKERLTKTVAGMICLALFCAGTVFLEYEMLLLFGAALVVFAAACALAVISVALYRAPEGDERPDGLHIRQRNRPRPFFWHVRQAREVSEALVPMNLSNLRDDVEPPPDTGWTKLRSTLQYPAQGSPPVVQQRLGIYYQQPGLVTQLGPWDQRNNRLKTVSCRNHLDQHRHADGTSLLCPPHLVFDTRS
jgi:hypothetical protein